MITQDIDRFNLITNMTKSDSYERYKKKYQQKVSSPSWGRGGEKKDIEKYLLRSVKKEGLLD